MTVERKITLGFSYLRSAVRDIILIQPSNPCRSILYQFIHEFSIYAKGFAPKCYNIHIKN